MEGLLQALMVTTILVTLLKTTESTLCSRTKDFTLYDPNNPDAQETCKRCQTCPPGQGLENHCGSRIPYGTSTGCRRCVYNETYSEKNDTSHCKPCNQCGFKTELQKCTPWQNSRCAATCRSGYYMDPVVDECKVVPENKTATAILASRNSTNGPSGMIATSQTKSPGTTTATVSTSGITASNSTSVDSSIRMGSTPMEDNVDGSSEGNSSSATNQDSGLWKVITISLGCICGVIFTFIIIIFAALKIKQYRSKSNILNFKDRDESDKKLQVIELHSMDRPPKKYHSQGCDTTRTPLLEDQSNANSNASSSGCDKTRTPVLENQSNANSNASSSENLQDNPTKVCAHKNVKLDVQHIPEDLLLTCILTDVNVRDDVARGLDDPVGPPGTSNWIHLAEVLQIPGEITMWCQHNPLCSPSKHMLEFKEAVDPNFSVQQLKDGLHAISRNDLVQKLEEFNLPHTAPFQDLREHHPKIFKLICMQLDHFNHWQELGKKIKIPDKKLQRIGTSSTCAKTVLEIIEKRNPNLTVQEMKLVLKDMSRKDVCDALDKCLPTEGCHTIKTVCENPYCLEEVATLLEKEARGVENWLYFAWKFDVPREICESLKPKETPSPTRALMEHIVQDKPNMTVRTFMKALMKIQRTDVVNALLKRLS